MRGREPDSKVHFVAMILLLLVASLFSLLHAIMNISVNNERIIQHKLAVETIDDLGARIKVLEIEQKTQQESGKQQESSKERLVDIEWARCRLITKFEEKWSIAGKMGYGDSGESNIGECRAIQEDEMQPISSRNKVVSVKYVSKEAKAGDDLIAAKNSCISEFCGNASESGSNLCASMASTIRYCTNVSSEKIKTRNTNFTESVESFYCRVLPDWKCARLHSSDRNSMALGVASGTLGACLSIFVLLYRHGAATALSLAIYRIPIGAIVGLLVIFALRGLKATFLVPLSSSVELEAPFGMALLCALSGFCAIRLVQLASTAISSMAEFFERKITGRAPPSGNSSQPGEAPGPPLSPSNPPAPSGGQEAVQPGHA